MSVDVTKMPKLGFGLMRLPEKDGELDLEQLCKMVDAYMTSGMNYFDTAYMYCGGKSESIIKKALVERYPRDSFTLTTKLPQWMMEEGIDGRDRIFNEQLARTGAGYFDYYLLHSVEDGANYEGYVKYDCFNWAMKKKEEGLIRHFGFSFHGTPELLDKISTHSLTRRLTAILFNKNRFVQFIFITLYQSPPQPLLLPPFFHPIFSFSARISGANRPRIGWGLGVRTIGSGYR